MRIDLHTHSHRSDGTDSAAQVVRLAAAADLDVVALTDHDTAAGWPEATSTAAEVGIGLIPGMEISCDHRHRGVHLLAYLIDPTYPPLVAELDLVLEGRASRLPTTLARLAEVGVELTAEDVAAVAGSTEAPGRPHVADALVAKGVVRDRDEAFRELLSPGRPGYVYRYAADLGRMIGLVAEAGGVAVIAHPWGRNSRGVLDRETLGGLRDAGLAGIEVDHHDHSPAARAELRAIAGDLGLVVTGSSDFHGAGKPGYTLGSNLTAPDQLERLMELARGAVQPVNLR